MLMTVGIILFVLWALGLFAFHHHDELPSRPHRAGGDRHRSAPGERNAASRRRSIASIERLRSTRICRLKEPAPKD